RGPCRPGSPPGLAAHRWAHPPGAPRAARPGGPQALTPRPPSRPHPPSGTTVGRDPTVASGGGPRALMARGPSGCGGREPAHPPDPSRPETFVQGRRWWQASAMTAEPGPQLSEKTLRSVDLHQIGEHRWMATNRRGGGVSVGPGDDPDFTP